MNDRSLLEYAAKAAKIDLYIEELPSGWIEMTDRNTLKVWNPILDDGDALRLAVKLDFDIIQDKNRKLIECYYGETDSEGWRIFISEKYNDNEYVATRRAITIAAAEIGKQLAGE